MTPRITSSVDDLRAAYEAQVRLWIPPNPPPGHRHEQHGPVVRMVGGHRGFIDPARDVGVRRAALDALIAEHRDFFAARGEAVEWKTRDGDQPEELTARLRAAGFVPEERETVLIGHADQMAVEHVVPVAIRRAAGREDFERVAALESEVYGTDDSWMADELEAVVRAAPEDAVVLVAEAHGQVVSAGRIEFMPGTEFAGLWGGATLEAWRGRGIYRALVAARARLALARGVRFLQVDASDDSRPILVRLGFHVVTTTTPYVWTPPAG